jgi:hypothetical protein
VIGHPTKHINIIFFISLLLIYLFFDFMTRLKSFHLKFEIELINKYMRTC